MTDIPKLSAWRRLWYCAVVEVATALVHDGKELPMDRSNPSNKTNKTREELLVEVSDLHIAADAHTRDMDALFLTIADPVVVYDLQTQVVRCNAAFRGIVGSYSHDPTGVTLQVRADDLGLRDVHG